jgi:alkylation response protein AidB-like acyl-CoA dehydrogenase
MAFFIEDLEWYCKESIQKYLDVPENELLYPEKIIADLKEFGLFGLNIPSKYGGFQLGLNENVKVMKELGKVWLSLPALIGTHFRANTYITECGTSEQKEKYLPEMAKGNFIFSHAYHEKATKNLKQISTTIEEVDGDFYLNGSKDWVTNSFHSDYYLVIARNISNNNKPVAIILNPNINGVIKEKELIRPGIKGISLSSVSFNNVKIDPTNDILGGVQFSVDEFIQKYKLNSSIGLAARAVGASNAVIEHTRKFVLSYSQRDNGNEIIAYNYASMYSKYLVAENTLNQVVQNFDSLPDKVATTYLTKVFCSQALQEIINSAIMLKGGYGYAATDGFLQRMFRDASSLLLIDTPNDILLYRSGIELLK